MKVGIIGYGAIGAALAAELAATPDRVVGILARESSAAAVRAKVAEALPVVTDLPALLSLSPDVVVECAGHAALREYGAAVLASGRHLVVSSVGALADEATESVLRASATGQGRLVIPSGALGGLDVLGAALRAGLDEVSYTSRKGPAAWRGTKAEELVDLAAVRDATVFYEGTARQAALDFPQNANVVAAVALAGIGFDRTRVRLLVDPEATGNRHLVEAWGAFGEISATVMARTLPANPKTSMLAPCSLARAVANLGGSVGV
jgi:aspartate dehydrogenase